MISVVPDEDLDVRLRLYFGPDVRAETVAYRGWRHLTNGALLRAARGRPPDGSDVARGP